jgi:hypothetical protein
MKSRCLSLGKVGKRGREEVDTYATGLDGRVCESSVSINDSGFGGGTPWSTPIASWSTSDTDSKLGIDPCAE